MARTMTIVCTISVKRRIVLCIALSIGLAFPVGCGRSLTDSSFDPFDELRAARRITAGPDLLSPDEGAVFTTTRRIVLRWSSVAGAEHYTVEAALDSTFANLLLSASVATTTYRTPVLPLARIFWRVSAVSTRMGQTHWSVVRSFTVRQVVTPS